MAAQFSPEVEAAIARAAAARGVSPETMRAFARIESGGDPRNVTGSYRGLFQLSPQEFARYGGTGDIHDPQANADAAAAKFEAESRAFQAKYGRPPTAHDLYMIHQQGEGGYAAHTSNPNLPAWQNMASTAEGRQKGEAWAKQAIWGNVPDDVKRQFGSVENMTSADFLNMWRGKVDRMSGVPSAAPVGGQTPSPAPNTAPTENAAPDASVGGFSTDAIRKAAASLGLSAPAARKPDEAGQQTYASASADPSGGWESPPQLPQFRMPKLNMQQLRAFTMRKA